MELLKQCFRTDHLKPLRHVSSAFVSTQTLFHIRVMLALLSIGIVLFSWSVFGLKVWFFFMTNTSLIGLTVYFILAAWHTHVLLKQGPEEFNRWMLRSPMYVCFWYNGLYSSLASLTLLISIVYWSLLFPLEPYPPTALKLSLNICGHVLNSIFFYTDVILTQLVLERIQVFWPIIFSLLYMIYMWTIMAASGGTYWTYPIYNFANPLCAVFYVATFFLVLITFTISYFVHQWREKYFPFVSIRHGDDESNSSEAIKF